MNFSVPSGRKFHWVWNAYLYLKSLSRCYYHRVFFIQLVWRPCRNFIFQWCARQLLVWNSSLMVCNLRMSWEETGRWKILRYFRPCPANIIACSFIDREHENVWEVSDGWLNLARRNGQYNIPGSQRNHYFYSHSLGIKKKSYPLTSFTRNCEMTWEEKVLSNSDVLIRFRWSVQRNIEINFVFV